MLSTSIKLRIYIYVVLILTNSLHFLYRKYVPFYNLQTPCT